MSHHCFRMLIQVIALGCLCSCDAHPGSQGDGSSGLLPPAAAWDPGRIAGVPRIDRISPSRGPNSGGILLQISGQEFASGATVTVGGVPATEVTVWSGTRLTARLPASPGTFGEVPLLVQNPSGSAQSVRVPFLYHARLPLFYHRLVGGPVTRTCVALADLNQDQKLDLISDAGDHVDVLLNTGDGEFALATHQALGVAPTAIVSADFDADQRPDLVVLSQSGNGLRVLRGDGRGGFLSIRSLGAGTAPVAVQVGDWNGDRKLDLIVANRDSNDVSVLLGDGMGDFSTAASIAVGTAPSDVALADLNGDSKLDMVVSCEGSGSISVVLGDGIGGVETVRTLALGSPLQAIAVGDLNQDRIPDLVTSTSAISGKTFILLADGLGGYSSPVSRSPAGYGVMALADLNDDALPDLITGNSSYANIGFGNGLGGFTIGKSVPFDGWLSGTNPRAVVGVGDVNGDVQLDVVRAAHLGLLVVLLNGDGTPLPERATSLGGIENLADSSAASALDDLDGDGNLDHAYVATDYYSSIGILYGDGRGGLLRGVRSSLPATGPLVLAAGALQADAKRSLVLSSGRGVAVVSTDANGAISGASQLPVTGTGPFQTALSDFDGDGKLDFAVLDTSGQTVRVYFGNGLGGASRAVTVDLPTGAPLSLATVDADADSRGDLVVGMSGSVVVVPGNGTGAFGPAQTWPTGGDARALSVTDLNGDKRSDLLFVDTGTGELGLLLNNGAGQFPNVARIANPRGASCITVGDVNGDRWPDVVLTKLNGYEPAVVSVYLGDGAGGMSAAEVFSPRRLYSCPTLGDWNDDRRADLLTAGPFLVGAVCSYFRAAHPSKAR